jgi:hypothetical protein
MTDLGLPGASVAGLLALWSLISSRTMRPHGGGQFRPILRWDELIGMRSTPTKAFRKPSSSLAGGSHA